MAGRDDKREAPAARAIAEANAVELRELREKEAAWSAERQALEQSIATMRSSTSWRVTAPIRGL